MPDPIQTFSPKVSYPTNPHETPRADALTIFASGVESIEAERDALKLKLEVAKDRLEKFTEKIEGSTAPIWGLEVAFLAREALSQLNDADDGESQPPSTTKGTLKAFEQIVNATPFPEGKEMIQTGRRDATGKVLLTKEQIHNLAMKIAIMITSYVAHTRTEDLSDNKMPEHEAAFTRIIEREIGAVTITASADTKGSYGA